MIAPSWFHKQLTERGVDFFCGVPDSLLKPYCNYIHVNEPQRHIIAVNEGAAVALAAGHYLGTKSPALVYLQNSGLGNMVNPLVSLASREVYGLPMVLLIGWRGEPGRPDEPQHQVQGRITPALLDCLDIPFSILPSSTDAIEHLLDQMMTHFQETPGPFALVVPKGRFEAVDFTPSSPSDFTREEAVQIIAEALPNETRVVATTGKISRELYEYRERSQTSGRLDFLTVGSMGHASAIALGLARSQPDHMVVCIDGDGAMLMHMGTVSTIGVEAPSNLTHIVLNNGCHESVGGLPSAGSVVDLSSIMRASGYPQVARVNNDVDLKSQLQSCLSTGLAGIEVLVSADSRSDLGRPKRTPQDAKRTFIEYTS